MAANGTPEYLSPMITVVSTSEPEDNNSHLPPDSLILSGGSTSTLSIASSSQVKILQESILQSEMSDSTVFTEAQMPANSLTTAVLLEPKIEPDLVSSEEEARSEGLNSDLVQVMPGSDIVSVASGIVRLPQHICPSAVTDSESMPQIGSVCLNCTEASCTSNNVVSTSFVPSSEHRMANDGTLTAAIQSGIPVTIDPASLTGPVALNQVFVPIYSNTDKGPVIELVPIKTSHACHTQVAD